MDPLRSENLVLRQVTPRDHELLVHAVRESVDSVGRWMPWCHKEYSTIEAQEWIANCEQGFTNKTSYEFGIFSLDGQLLGVSGLNQINKQQNFCNLGYWVRESHQRKGVATSAVKMLSKFAFLKIGFTRIELVIRQGNEASVAVARKVGAQFECVARYRLFIHGVPEAASVYALIP